MSHTPPSDDEGRDSSGESIDSGRAWARRTPSPELQYAGAGRGRRGHGMAAEGASSKEAAIGGVFPDVSERVPGAYMQQNDQNLPLERKLDSVAGSEEMRAAGFKEETLSQVAMLFCGRAALGTWQTRRHCCSLKSAKDISRKLSRCCVLGIADGSEWRAGTSVAERAMEDSLKTNTFTPAACMRMVLIPDMDCRQRPIELTCCKEITFKRSGLRSRVEFLRDDNTCLWLHGVAREECENIVDALSACRSYNQQSRNKVEEVSATQPDKVGTRSRVASHNAGAVPEFVQPAAKSMPRIPKLELGDLDSHFSKHTEAKAKIVTSPPVPKLKLEGVGQNAQQQTEQSPPPVSVSSAVREAEALLSGNHVPIVFERESKPPGRAFVTASMGILRSPEHDPNGCQEARSQIHSNSSTGNGPLPPPRRTANHVWATAQASASAQNPASQSIDRAAGSQAVGNHGGVAPIVPKLQLDGIEGQFGKAKEQPPPGRQDPLFVPPSQPVIPPPRRPLYKMPQYKLPLLPSTSPSSMTIASEAPPLQPSRDIETALANFDSYISENKDGYGTAPVLLDGQMRERSMPIPGKNVVLF